MPDSSGPTLWQRTGGGWQEHPEVSVQLTGVPGRADVWYENRLVTAVGVSDSSLYVFRMEPERSSSAHWKSQVLASLKIPRKDPKIETATIARDAAGAWWIAADVGGNAIYVWRSKDAKHWSRGLLIAENMAADDICSIAALAGSVIVVWTDQKNQTVYCREHKNGRSLKHWEKIQIVESGNETADDHLHLTVSSNGTLWAATKNSLDKNGYPQLVMRVRDPEGNWKNFPYLNLTEENGPSRPVIITTPDPQLVLSGHTVYDYTNKKRYADRIAFGIVDTSSAELLVSQADVIAPDTSLGIMINNITVPKAAFPVEGPWIILASDKKGNIYEADLKRFFDGNVHQ